MEIIEYMKVLNHGLSNWWATNGRSNTTYNERLELEYYYIKIILYY